MEENAILALNRNSWEFANKKSNKRKGDFAEAIRSGAEVIPREVVDYLDPDPHDKILHLLCNDGREAAFLGNRFGSHVYGVDFSASAIKFAQQLNGSLNLSNGFVQADAYSWLKNNADHSFTKTFISLGSVRWLYDLPRFFQLSRGTLVDGGLFLLWDFHPVLGCLDGNRVWVGDYPFTSYSFVRELGVHDYTASPERYTLLSRRLDTDVSEFSNDQSVYFNLHSLSGILNSALQANFSLKTFLEYQFCWEERYLPWLIETEPRRFVAPDGVSKIPLTFLFVFEAM